MPTTTNNRSNFGHATYNWQYWNHLGVLESTGPLIYPISYPVQEHSKTWIRTPGFQALRRSGALLPDNAFSFYLKRWGNVGEEFHFEQDARSPSNRLLWSLDVSKPFWAKSDDPGIELSEFDLDSRLIDRARASDFSLPVTLVEGRQTVRMIAETARTLASSIYDLRRGDLVGAMRHLRGQPTRAQTRRFNRRYGVNPASTASSYWLQLQYGWKPLLNDAKNIAEALAEAVLRNGDSMTSTVTATSRLHSSRTWNNHTIGVSPYSQGRLTADVSITRKGKWRFRPNSADLPGLFGLTNPFEVVWEIVPFSFVADWFLPIGNYLSTLDAPLRFSHVGGSKGYRKRTVWTTEPQSASFFAGNWTAYASGQTAEIGEVVVTRTPIVSIPSPRLADMRFEPRMGSVQATSAIALLWQQASQLRR